GAAVVRAVTDPQVDLPGLDHELTFVVVEPEVRASEGERDRLGLPRVERYSLKALQLAHRLQDARVVLMQIQLGDVGAGRRSRVADGHGDLQLPAGRHAGGRQVRGADVERRVGQA